MSDSLLILVNFKPSLESYVWERALFTDTKTNIVMLAETICTQISTMVYSKVLIHVVE